MGLYNYSQVEEIEKFMEIKIIEFGRRVKEIRLSRKLTQENLAELASINTKYLGEIERGKKKATAFVLYKISNALGVPVCEILSTNSCPYAKGSIPKEIADLLAGKQKKDLQKAERILSILFE